MIDGQTSVWGYIPLVRAFLGRAHHHIHSALSRCDGRTREYHRRTCLPVCRPRTPATASPAFCVGRGHHPPGRADDGWMEKRPSGSGARPALLSRRLSRSRVATGGRRRAGAGRATSARHRQSATAARLPCLASRWLVSRAPYRARGSWDGNVGSRTAAGARGRRGVYLLCVPAK